MQKVKCKTCGSEIILTNKEDLIKWKEKGEICFRCTKAKKTKELGSLMKRRQTKKEAQKMQEEVKESKPMDEKEILLKEKFEKLLEVRKQYFDSLHGKKRDEGVIDEIEDFFGVPLYEVFDCHEYDFCEFFNMGEDGDADLTWNDLIDLIKEYKKNHRD